MIDSAPRTSCSHLAKATRQFNATSGRPKNWKQCVPNDDECSMGCVTKGETMQLVSDIRLSKMTDEALSMCGWPNKEQAELIIRDILLMADEWANGALPLHEIRRLCTPQERFLTARFVKPMPQSFFDLLTALDATSTSTST